MLGPASIPPRPAAKRRHWRSVVLACLRHLPATRAGGPAAAGHAPRRGLGRSCDRARRTLAVIHWRSTGRLWALKTRSIRRVLAVGLLVLAGVVAACLGTAWWLSAQSPSWWAPADARDPAVQRLAEALENGTITTMNQVRPGGGPWAMAVTEHAANAWLAARLRPWLVSQAGLDRWPPGVDRVMVRFEPGVVRLGVELLEAGRRRVLSVAFTPEARAGPAPSQGPRGGELWIEPTWVHVGRLPLPAGWVLSGAVGTGAHLPADLAALPQTPALLQALRGLAPVVRAASVRLPDGRRLLLEGVRAEEGRLVITWRPAPEPR